MVDNPGDPDLLQQEMDMAQDLRELISSRDSFLIQKAKIQWSLEGDLNTNYFHHAIKKRIHLNKNLLGSHTVTNRVNQTVVRQGACCTVEHWNILIKPVTAKEVKHCLFSIPKGKSPGPDGYGSKFFRDAWDIIRDEICAAAINFFDSGKLLS
ncbi:uncharacterized protein LOC141649027 [Silene latifolia]|uniref:uncharacterized protein LOC141649027 n=1 Tax=Silene latifolia TaxID=37657 RepID=UPI003D76A9FB